LLAEMLDQPGIAVLRLGLVAECRNVDFLFGVGVWRLLFRLLRIDLFGQEQFVFIVGLGLRIVRLVPVLSLTRLRPGGCLWRGETKPSEKAVRLNSSEGI
jgi:hypothetical protein